MTAARGNEAKEQESCHPKYDPKYVVLLRGPSRFAVIEKYNERTFIGAEAKDSS